jgi:uncharacterized DUF497 family protein
MRFDWDPRKAAAKEAQHGIGFDLAITAFDDPHALLAPDERHSSSEEIREWLIGESDRSILVVVFTRRSGDRIVRIISARRASRGERKSYEKCKELPI